MVNVMHRVRALTTKMRTLLTTCTATTTRLYVVVKHVVEEGSLIRQGEASIIREGGGSLQDSTVEDADAEDIGDVGGGVLEVLMLQYRCRRSVAI